MEPPFGNDKNRLLPTYMPVRDHALTTIPVVFKMQAGVDTGSIIEYSLFTWLSVWHFYMFSYFLKNLFKNLGLPNLSARR
jgi:hypothetical protein